MNVSLFADDAVIYCSIYEQYFIRIRLERSFHRVIEWCKSNFININIGKTKFCICDTKSRIDYFNGDVLGENKSQIRRCLIIMSSLP